MTIISNFSFYESDYALHLQYITYIGLPQAELCVFFLQLRRYVDYGDSWRS